MYRLGQIICRPTLKWVQLYQRPSFEWQDGIQTLYREFLLEHGLFSYLRNLQGYLSLKQEKGMFLNSTNTETEVLAVNINQN